VAVRSTALEAAPRTVKLVATAAVRETSLLSAPLVANPSEIEEVRVTVLDAVDGGTARASDNDDVRVTVLAAVDAGSDSDRPTEHVTFLTSPVGASRVIRRGRTLYG
jgi:hypothetical protein